MSSFLRQVTSNTWKRQGRGRDGVVYVHNIYVIFYTYFKNLNTVATMFKSVVESYNCVCCSNHFLFQNINIPFLSHSQLQNCIDFTNCVFNQTKLGMIWQVSNNIELTQSFPSYYCLMDLPSIVRIQIVP